MDEQWRSYYLRHRNFNMQQWREAQDARRASLIRVAVADGAFDDPDELAKRVMLSRGFSRHEAEAFRTGATLVNEARQQAASITKNLPMYVQSMLYRVLAAGDTDEQVKAWLRLIQEIVAEIKLEQQELREQQELDEELEAGSLGKWLDEEDKA